MPFWKANVHLSANGSKANMAEMPLDERREVFVGQALGLMGMLDEKYPNQVAIYMDPSESSTHGVDIRFEPTGVVQGDHGINGPTPLCPYCICLPCLSHVLDDGEDIRRFMDEMAKDGLTNKEVRHHTYRKIARTLYGILGKGNRVELPNCLIDY